MVDLGFLLLQHPRRQVPARYKAQDSIATLNGAGPTTVSITTTDLVVSSFSADDVYTVTATCSSGVRVGGGVRLLFNQTND
jgi:hypothetical protein